ncbi:MAG: cation diffusion facilitator family transporter [Planctomycetota bacterium]|nr:MAG: cation diffusion facilitator family transporter [Planctomycetota bacterium]
MSMPDLSLWQHSHEFDAGNPLAERNTWRVVGLSATMMIVEIVAGWWSGSMALLADGWHMSTHVAALGITAGAYWLARQYARDARFAFGTFKIEVLGGFASAIILSLVALLMVAESIERLFAPHSIHYEQALVVAVIGLVVNLASVWLLGDGPGHLHDHDHDHSHDHDHDSPGGQHHDLNLRAAYVHVLADAATSVLAIIALLGGKFWNWAWLDPTMGIVGAVLVGVWSSGLIRATSRVLLDREMDHALVAAIREAIESDGHSHVSDLHLWRVGRAHFACIVAVVSREPHTADDYREQLRPHEELVHVTVEVRQVE